MRRVTFLVVGSVWLAVFPLGVSSARAGAPAGYTLTPMDPNLCKSWLGSWDKAILSDGDIKDCNSVMGEDTAWLMSPFTNGFYYGYAATKDPNWVMQLVKQASGWIKRGIIEPDGYMGWPSYNAAGTPVDNLNSYYADSMLGDAMALTPIVKMAEVILSTPSLDAKYDANAKAYLALANQMYAKWQSRGGFRDTPGGGAISVVQPWGIVDPNHPAQAWTSKYPLRKDPNWGFSMPNNKNNEVGEWMLAMYDATGDANYKTQATKWYTLFKSRLTPQSNGTYAVWNYWQPAGTEAKCPWDYDPNNGVAKLWIGVHPNNGYYQMDTESMVDAYEHGVVFTLADIQRLVATDLSLLATDGNRLWPALAPYNTTIQALVQSSCVPSSWGGYTEVPWYLSLQVQYAPEPASLTLLACGAAALLRRRRR